VPCRVHKEKRGSPQIQGLPGKKKGDRENLSPRIWWWIVDYLRTCYFDYLVIKSK